MPKYDDFSKKTYKQSKIDEWEVIDEAPQAHEAEAEELEDLEILQNKDAAEADEAELNEIDIIDNLDHKIAEEAEDILKLRREETTIIRVEPEDKEIINTLEVNHNLKQPGNNREQMAFKEALNGLKGATQEELEMEEQNDVVFARKG